MSISLAAAAAAFVALSLMCSFCPMTAAWRKVPRVECRRSASEVQWKPKERVISSALKSSVIPGSDQTYRDGFVAILSRHDLRTQRCCCRQESEDACWFGDLFEFVSVSTVLTRRNCGNENECNSPYAQMLSLHPHLQPPSRRRPALSIPS